MKNILTIQNKLEKINKTLYIVWGFCREQILWNNNTDWDIDLVTDAKPSEMKQVLKIVWEVGKKYWTCIVLEWWQSFELTTFRKDIWSINYRKPAEVEFTDSVEEEAKRRDFTFNSIYYNPKTEKYIDPENWIKDIKNKTVRFVGHIEDRIQEDALRILRFIRFKNKYSFRVADEKYWGILEKHTPLLRNLPIERIKQELDKILLNLNNVQALEDLKKIWFLKIFLPELDCLDKCGWNKYHLEWDVWIHTKMCLEEMNKFLKEENNNTSKSPLLNKEGARGWSLLLLRTILLHDIWKWPTYSVWEDWETHYYNHDNVWAEIFKEEISPRLKFPKSFENEIYFIITHHLRAFSIPKMRKLKARKLMMHKYFDDLLVVSKADCYWKIPQNIESFNEIVQIYNEFKEILKTKKFFTGYDIMEKYPELEWREIWERLKMINEQILVVD